MMKKWFCLAVILAILIGIGIAKSNEDLLGRILMIDTWDGKCPVCKEQGLKSRVYERGCSSTLMATHTWYDEEGRFHYENPNRTICNYTCSNGHHFSQSF